MINKPFQNSIMKLKQLTANHPYSSHLGRRPEMSLSWTTLLVTTEWLFLLWFIKHSRSSLCFPLCGPSFLLKTSPSYPNNKEDFWKYRQESLFCSLLFFLSFSFILCLRMERYYLFYCPRLRFFRIFTPFRKHNCLSICNLLYVCCL